MKKIVLFFMLLVASTRLTAGDDFCGIHNRSFQSEESITFYVFYSVIGLFVNAGNATFTANLENYNKKPAYHLVGVGNSNTSYDWIFKVRDRYESFVDTANLQPMKFMRNIDEGGYKTKEDVTFNQSNNTVLCSKGTVAVPNCIQDVLSSIYYARNLDFNSFKEGDKIPFDMFLDNDVRHLYIKYMGKEIIKTRYGKFKAIKFKPLLVAGTMFTGGEKMTVWVSDDPNHIPLRIESPIVVGTVKVDMMEYRNLRYPLTALLNLR